MSKSSEKHISRREFIQRMGVLASTLTFNTASRAILSHIPDSSRPVDMLLGQPEASSNAIIDRIWPSVRESVYDSTNTSADTRSTVDSEENQINIGDVLEVAALGAMNGAGRPEYSSIAGPLEAPLVRAVPDFVASLVTDRIAEGAPVIVGDGLVRFVTTAIHAKSNGEGPLRILWEGLRPGALDAKVTDITNRAGYVAGTIARALAFISESVTRTFVQNHATTQNPPSTSLK